MRHALGVLTVASLLLCLAAPFLYVHGVASMASYRNILLAGSIAYFVFATAWTGARP
jgi:hypothetical protein